MKATPTLNSILNGEQILWQGRPKQGFQFVTYDLIIIPFTILFFFIGISMVIESKNLLPAIIVISGFCLVWKRYIIDFKEIKSSQYYVTSHKVVIATPKKTYIIPYEKIGIFSFIEHPFSYKYGTVVFGEEENIFGSVDEKFSLGTRGGINLSRNDVAIEFIEDYKLVYNIIKQKVSEKKDVNSK